MNMQDYKKVFDRIEPDAECRNEVLNMKNKSKVKRIKGGKTIAVALSAVIAVCGGTVAVAEYTDIFDKLAHNSERTVTNDVGNEFPVDKFDKNNYESIGRHAQYLSEPLTAENDGIKIEVSSVYCDGKTLVVGLTGELKNGNPERVGYIGFQPELLVNGEWYSMNSFAGSQLQGTHSNLILDEDSENSFSGSMTFIMSEEYRLTETVHIDINISEFNCSEKYWTDPLEITDGLSLSLDVTPNLELVNSSVSSEDNRVKDDGFSLKIHEITPAMITVSAEYPHEFEIIKKYIDMYYEGRNQEYDYDYSIVPLYYDENDEKISFLEIDPIDLGLGKYAVCLQNSGAEKITVKFVNKQKADENGNPVVLKELTVDIDNISE